MTTYKRRQVRGGIDFTDDSGKVHLKIRMRSASNPADSPADRTKKLRADQARWDSRSRGGRPTSANWPAIREALRLEVQLRGMPDRENPSGWRTNADVEAWAATN